MLADFIAYHILMSREIPPILAVGAFFNNTVCVTLGSEAYISNSLGNLDSPDACRQHEKIARHLLRMLDYKPHAIAHDFHPDFHSTRFAAQLAAELDVPLIAVQHHHAHIAAICAEHQIDNPVLGLALDGIGLGIDGNAWGGELLCVNGSEFQRIGHLHPLHLPGGDRAAQEPWRMAAAVLHEAGRNNEITQRFPNQLAAATVALMLQRDLNCPPTSSMGRVFDAAAGLLGLCSTMTFDAEAAIALERAATRYIDIKGWPSALQNGWEITQDGVLNLLPTLIYLAGVRHTKHDVDLSAAIFHATLVAALRDWLQQSSERTGINTITCGGGCFLNKLLSTELRIQCTAVGLTIFTAQTIAPGDSGIALGQAWVATRLIL
jgi:hydrogenase maturation protein HypF